jgi:iron transport multicopper oxidase
LVITTGDWYHDQAPYLLQYYESKDNNDNGGPEPIPDSGLINDGQNVPIKVEPGKTYLLRVINQGNFVGTYLEIDDHELTIVEADGVYTEPKTVSRLYLAVAQRYGVLLTTKETARENYIIKCMLDTSQWCLCR